MPKEKPAAQPRPQLDDAQALHLRLPVEIKDLEEAVEFFTKKNNQGQLSKLIPQLDHARDMLGHAVQAATFIETLGLTNEVHAAPNDEAATYTRNDAVALVAKLLHEHALHEAGLADIPSHYARAHAHLEGVNAEGTPEVEGENPNPHCCPVRLAKPRCTADELVEHLNLTDPAHVAAAIALFPCTES